MLMDISEQLGRERGFIAFYMGRPRRKKEQTTTGGHPRGIFLLSPQLKGPGEERRKVGRSNHFYLPSYIISFHFPKLLDP